MKIFNQEKNIELNESEIDYTLGKIIPDKILKAHHQAVIGKSAEEIAKELISKGEVCNLRFDGNWYKQTKVYENGGSEEEQIYLIEAKDAYDEYEDILVFVPYTEEELHENQITYLREKREEECFPIINRGQLWYNGLTVAQKTELQTWYTAWLNVTETLIVPEKPIWLK